MKAEDFLCQFSRDILAIGRATGWCEPQLADFYCELKEMSQHRILRSTFRGLLPFDSPERISK